MGRPDVYGDLESLLQGRPRKLILLDDSILAHARAGDLLEQMAAHDVQVSFTQTLDIRLLDGEKAATLLRIRSSNTGFTRRVYHFSLYDCRNLDLVRSKYNLLSFQRCDSVEFVCMYGYNTTLAEDVERFSFLRSLPGAHVFARQYQPVPGGPPPDIARFFGPHADGLIDRLVAIVFPQNMKSMQKYCRWLNRLYAQSFVTLH